MLGSLQDAEDLLQETLLAAWRGLDRLRGARVAARLAVPDRHQSLSERASRPQAPPTGGAFRWPSHPSPPAWPSRSWLEPYPDALLEGLADTAPGPEARYETRESVGLAFVGRAATPAATPASGARAPRRARLSHRRGSRDARHQRGLGQRAPCSGRARRSTQRRPMAAASAHRCRTPHTSASSSATSPPRVERGDTEGIISLLTDDAWLTMPPATVRVPGRAGDRQIPRTARTAPSRQPPARADPRQRPTRLRLLPARSARADRPRLRTDGADAHRGPRIGDHMVRRAQPLLPLRAPANTRQVGAGGGAQRPSRRVSPIRTGTLKRAAYAAGVSPSCSICAAYFSSQA